MESRRRREQFVPRVGTPCGRNSFVGDLVGLRVLSRCSVLTASRVVADGESAELARNEELPKSWLVEEGGGGGGKSPIITSSSVPASLERTAGNGIQVTLYVALAGRKKGRYKDTVEW